MCVPGLMTALASPLVGEGVTAPQPSVHMAYTHEHSQGCSQPVEVESMSPAGTGT